MCLHVWITKGVILVSEVLATGYNNIGGVSDMDEKLSKEEFAKSLIRSLKQFAPVMLGDEKPKNNAREKIAEWKKLAEEVGEDE